MKIFSDTETKKLKSAREYIAGFCSSQLNPFGSGNILEHPSYIMSGPYLLNLIIRYMNPNSFRTSPTGAVPGVQATSVYYSNSKFRNDLTVPLPFNIRLIFDNDYKDTGLALYYEEDISFSLFKLSSFAPKFLHEAIWFSANEDPEKKHETLNLSRRALDCLLNGYLVPLNDRPNLIQDLKESNDPHFKYWCDIGMTPMSMEEYIHADA